MKTASIGSGTVVQSLEVFQQNGVVSLIVRTYRF